MAEIDRIGAVLDRHFETAPDEWLYPKDVALKCGVPTKHAEDAVLWLASRGKLVIQHEKTGNMRIWGPE